MKRHLIFLFGLGLVLVSIFINISGCGQSGALYLPTQHPENLKK